MEKTVLYKNMNNWYNLPELSWVYSCTVMIYIISQYRGKERVNAMAIDSAIGSRIRHAREMNHYTREELAEYAGISSKFLYEIEKSQKGFSATTLLKICKALDVSCDYILTGENATKCNEELIDIIESFDTTQITNVKKMLLIMLEVSKF